LLSKFNSRKTEDGGSRHFEIHLNGRNSVIFEHIRTNFDTDTKKDVPKTFLHSDFTSERIQDGDGRHFENLFNGYISDSMAYTVFAWNFANGLKTVSHNRFCCKIHFPDSAKSKMAAAAIFTFNLTAIIAYIRTTFGTASKSDVSVTGLPKYTLCSKNTHSHFLLYLHEWRVDINKNCSEYTQGTVDSDNGEIRYSLRPMTSSWRHICLANVGASLQHAISHEPRISFFASKWYLMAHRCGRIVYYVVEFKLI